MTAFVFVLLVLSAYRLTRLLVKDTLPPVLALRDRLAGGWRPLTLKEHNEPLQARTWRSQIFDDREMRWVEKKPWSPYWLGELITCPWCASAYVSGALTVLTDVFYGVPAPWLTGVAVWAGAALLTSQEWA